ncbi:MAG: hypothetical protein SV686_02965 [Thermodesulfobacteriota bacterium]|nr:hypothetical protein [Thermodesulfobacteriota bacterium]
MPGKNSFQTFLENFKSGVADLTTLDVVTLTGEIKISSSMPGDPKKIDLQELYRHIEESAGMEGKLKVVSFTHIDGDCDVVNFVGSELGEAEQVLLKAHREIVKTSQETRQAMVKFIKELLPY